MNAFTWPDENGDGKGLPPQREVPRKRGTLYSLNKDSKSVEKQSNFNGQLVLVVVARR